MTAVAAGCSNSWPPNTSTSKCGTYISDINAEAGTYPTNGYSGSY